MTAPVGTSPELAAYLQGLEDQIAVLTNPGSPTLLFPMLSANLTTANAATYINRQVFVTDLSVIGYSSGAHWYRTDTAAVIV